MVQLGDQHGFFRPQVKGGQHVVLHLARHELHDEGVLPGAGRSGDDDHVPQAPRL
jgi:hypothetical protein